MRVVISYMNAMFSVLFGSNLQQKTLEMCQIEVELQSHNGTLAVFTSTEANLTKGENEPYVVLNKPINSAVKTLKLFNSF